MKKNILWLTLFICSIGQLSAETITGSACYRYSDNESINVARDIAFSMAKRSALEGYSVFVDSTITVENAVLKNDLISSLTAGLLKNLRVTAKSEDLQKKEVCRTIQAEVEPFEIKSRITSKIKTYRRKHSNFETGLPENEYQKVLKVKTLPDNPYTGRPFPTLLVVAQCKKSYRWNIFMRITYYDEDGIPEGMYKESNICDSKDDIIRYYLYLPRNSKFTYSFDIPE